MLKKTEFLYPALPDQSKYNISCLEGQKNLFTRKCLIILINYVLPGLAFRNTIPPKYKQNGRSNTSPVVLT